MTEPILGKRTLETYLNSYEWDENQLKKDQSILKKWADSLDGKWANKKETELTASFYHQILIEILGYEEGPADSFTIGYENRTKSSAQKPDVVLGDFTADNSEQPVALIEFESPYTSLDAHNKGVEQAFSYQSQYNKPVQWIVASNFRETRIYNQTREHVEIFDIHKLATDMNELKKFVFFLGADFLVKKSNSNEILLEKALEENVADEQALTSQFYDDYLKTRNKLIKNIQKNNLNVDSRQAFSYAQKILDRFIFVAFAQDYELIPSNTFEMVTNVSGGNFDRYPIWTQMKGLFNAIDEGWPEKDINHFNGGLFKPDSNLDALHITDDVFEDFKVIDSYDFKSDLSINLLGHIFEQAVNDIDAAKKGNNSSNKRKHDGIFYTPSSITSYLLTETLQSWLDDKYSELSLNAQSNFNDTDYEEYRNYYYSDKSKRKKPNKRVQAVSKYVNKLEQLKDKIKSIKIIDPAVGSGSFLTQSLDSLKELLNRIQNTIDNITLQPTIPTPDTEILSKNLFGVDINKESVEIAKLSLWLRTASKTDPLTTLDDNLKVGNSIIDDKKVTKKAFVWSQEFPDIFNKNRGFDIVLGNPPYVTSQENMTDSEKEYYKSNYSMSQYQENLYRIFVEKGFNLLCPGGWFGFIVPKTWFNNINYSKMRAFLMEKTSNLKIIDIEDQVFPDANVDTSLIMFKKPLQPVKSKYITVGKWKNNQLIFQQKQKISNNISAPIMINKSNNIDNNIINKLDKNKVDILENYLNVTDGIKLFERGKGNPKQPTDKTAFENFKKNNDFFSDKKLNSDYYPFYDGKQLKRYFISHSTKFLHYSTQLAAKRNIDNFKGEHILIRRIPNRGKYVIIASIISSGINLHEQAIWDAQPINKKVNLKVMLGVLNSTITSFHLIMNLGILSRKTFPQLRSNAIKKIPIPKLSSYRKNIIIQNVDKLLQYEKEKAKIEDEYQTTFKIYVNKPISFKKVLEDVSNINECVKKVPIKVQASFIKFTEELVIKYKNVDEKSNECNKKIDQQLYSAFKLTPNEIEFLENELNEI